MATAPSITKSSFKVLELELMHLERNKGLCESEWHMCLWCSASAVVGNIGIGGALGSVQ